MKNEYKTKPDEKQIASPRPVNKLIHRHPDASGNPGRLLIVLIISAFIAETLVMFLLSALPPLSVPAVAFLDALLLAILLSPLVHFFIMRQVRFYVAKHRHFEEAQIVSEEKYRSLVESTDDSVYLLDRDCRYLYMNKKHMARMGFSGDEYLGRKYSDLHPAEGTKEFVEAVGKIFEIGEPAQHEHMSQRDKKYFLRTLSPVRGNDGKTVAVNIVSKEITSLKKMEAERESLILELREALAKIKTLKGLIPVCAWCKKVRDDKGYWNEIETYVKNHSDADFTHGICPECLKVLEDKEGRLTGEQNK
ncbi:MAG TPA: PAS domain-containing protein [Thermodesulfovibrionales bacterium]|nr:PAS domain-containing protein [Thermodesulfovibrionales bacterium]